MEIQRINDVLFAIDKSGNKYKIFYHESSCHLCDITIKDCQYKSWCYDKLGPTAYLSLYHKNKEEPVFIKPNLPDELL